MAPNDAEMPDHQALSDDLQEIAKHLSNLRKDVERLTGSIGRTGSHQMENLQGRADDMVSAVEDAVRRGPLSSLGIAAGLGLLLAILMRR